MQGLNTHAQNSFTRFELKIPSAKAAQIAEILVAIGKFADFEITQISEKTAQNKLISDNLAIFNAMKGSVKGSTSDDEVAEFKVQKYAK